VQPTRRKELDCTHSLGHQERRNRLPCITPVSRNRKAALGSHQIVKRSGGKHNKTLLSIQLPVFVERVATPGRALEVPHGAPSRSRQFALALPLKAPSFLHDSPPEGGEDRVGLRGWYRPKFSYEKGLRGPKRGGGLLTPVTIIRKDSCCTESAAEERGIASR